MPIRSLATLAVAIFLGLVAVVLVRNYVGPSGQSNQVALLETTPVVVSTQQIPRGAALEPQMLKVVKFPKDAVPAGAFENILQVASPKEGSRLALRRFAPNEPLLATNVSAPGAKPILSEALTDGMRAVSLRSGDVTGVAGFVLPGDRVDVLLTRTMTSDKRDAVSQVVAENVLVLGVDQSDNNEVTKPVVAKSVTIQVTPEQAEAISLAQAIGEVSLSLRRFADEKTLTKRATTVADFGFDLPREAARARAVSAVARATPPQPLPFAPPPVVVRVVRGIETTLYAGTETSLAPLGSPRGVAAVPRTLPNAAAAIPAAIAAP